MLGSVATAALATPRSLTIEERVALEERVQRVLEKQRVWPDGNPPRPRLEARLSTEDLRRKMQRTLAESTVLRSRWGVVIDETALQGEMDRMARTTRNPELLRELFAALGNDPYLVAEGLARPFLVSGQFSQRFALDAAIHAGPRHEAERLRDLWLQGRLREAGVQIQSRRIARDGSCWALEPGVEGADEKRFLEAAKGLDSPGSIGLVEETTTGFTVRKLVSLSEEEVDLEVLTVPKESPELWLDSQVHGEPGAPVVDDALLRLPQITGYRASNFHDAGPNGIGWPTAVWTGSEMLVWGSSGWRYDPATDTWRPMSQGNEPAFREEHTAVWTGTEMIVWGGETFPTRLNTGGRYDPATDTWRPTTQTGAPGPRKNHVAVWTGTEMLIWGGEDQGVFNEGGRYSPSTDSWLPIPPDPVFPTGRISHTAAWTGSEMIVWGGYDGTSTPQVAGGRYAPSTGIWTPTSAGAGVPTARMWHSCVWTGTEMVVWGGTELSTLQATNTGAKYNPFSDIWLPTDLSVGTPSARHAHVACWTGSRMLIWGGEAPVGGSYDPVNDNWQSISSGGSPSQRWSAAVSWTGQEMIVWGGGQASPQSTGGRYDPVKDMWSPTSLGPYSPGNRQYHTAVWTGAEMIVWGGFQGGSTWLNDGGRYYPAVDAWLPTSMGANVPSARAYHTAVWSGSDMIIWGGSSLADGGRYDPATDTWRTMLKFVPGAIGAEFHTAVWTGTEMIVFGGYDGTQIQGKGGRYDPASDTWAPIPNTLSRWKHVAVWTGSQMVVWGGGPGPNNDGGRYDPASNTWTLTTMAGVPSPRFFLSGVWTGTEMIVWGGAPDTNTGGRYDPVLDSWMPTSTGANLPEARHQHTAVWTGSRMVVWGGDPASASFTNTGGVYDPAADSWQPTSLVGAPDPIYAHTAVWTGKEMVTFGQGGGRYDSATNTWDDDWGNDPPLGDDVLVGKGPGGGGFYGAGIRGLRVDGFPTPTIISAFPEYVGFGVKVASGDVSAGGPAEVIAGAGPGPVFPAEVRGFQADGSPVAGLDFFAYATAGYGANVGSGRIDGQDEMLTGPGPSGVFGPHVRGFRYSAGAVAALPKVSFYAYGTLRYGVSPAAGELDLDGFAEIETAAGPGVVFGPHVRGFDYDGGPVATMAKVSFFAYGTPRYGVEANTGDMDGDGYDEMLTGPGPSPNFSAQLRGFNYDGASVAAMAKINAIVFTSRYGLNVAAGDLETDGYDEIASGPGPDPAVASMVRGFNFDGASLTGIPPLDKDFYSVAYGVTVAVGTMGY